MFYGLSKFLKNILPKSLFYRALLIVAVPVLVLQLVITIVFFDSLWIKTTKGMTRALVNEISTFLEVYNNEKRFDSLKKVFNAFKNVEFEDYAYMVFDTIDYKDISHLSKYGMRKFSDTLALKHKSIFKTK